jgi:hypothetical protein
MKKLGKLNIAPEKVMKNEELINLRGGYDINCTSPKKAYQCGCSDGSAVWHGCYLDIYDTFKDLHTYCGNHIGSGTCHVLG